jgi:D-arabinose 1-dehydrogenase-like Zn-dependent alcohol dehydrogenase
MKNARIAGQNEALEIHDITGPKPKGLQVLYNMMPAGVCCHSRNIRLVDGRYEDQDIVCLSLPISNLLDSTVNWFIAHMWSN